MILLKIHEIKNTGNALLNIDDVLPTCGCIIFDETQKTIVRPKEKEEVIKSRMHNWKV